MDFALGIRKGPDLVMDLALAMGTKRECGLLPVTFDFAMASNYGFAILCRELTLTLSFFHGKL